MKTQNSKIAKNVATTETVDVMETKVIDLAIETKTPEILKIEAELITKFKQDPQQLFRAVAMKKLNQDEYNAKAVTPEIKAELASMTTNEKLAYLGITVVAESKKEVKAKIKTEKAPKPEKVAVVTEDIASLPAGSVITYGTSKKPYIISEVNEKGRMLFSMTQKFFSSKPSFAVVVVHKGTGELPIKFEDPALNDLLAQAAVELKDRQAKITTQAAEKLAKEQARAEKAAKKEKIEEPVMATTEVAPVLETKKVKVSKKA